MQIKSLRRHFSDLPLKWYQTIFLKKCLYLSTFLELFPDYTSFSLFEHKAKKKNISKNLFKIRKSCKELCQENHSTWKPKSEAQYRNDPNFSDRLSWANNVFDRIEWEISLGNFCDYLDKLVLSKDKWAPPSEFVSSSIPSWQTLTAHAQPFRGARDLAFCLKVPLDSLLVWASSEGSGETARMRRLAWTFATRIDDKYQIRLTRSK